MAWTVQYTGNAVKGAAKLRSKRLKQLLMALEEEIKTSGPVRGNWKNYSKLAANEHHCHLDYRHSVVWRVLEHNVVEIYYVGKRESAPYD